MTVSTTDPTTAQDVDPEPAAPHRTETTTEVVRPGRNDLGAVTLGPKVVSKIVAQAVTEVPNAGSAAPRILGRAVTAGVPGVRQTQLGGQPKVAVDVDRSVASIEIAISVRWPASVPEVTAAVREHVAERLTELTGLTVTDIRIHVSDLITRLPAPPRVH